MKCLFGGALTLMLAMPAWGAGDDPKEKPPEPATPGEQYKALLREYQNELKAYSKAVQAAKTPEDQQKAFTDHYPKPEKYSPRFVALAEKNPKDPVALDALIWVLSNRFGPGNGKDGSAKAIAILERDHADSPKLASICQTMAYSIDKGSISFLRTLLAKSPHGEVKAEACLALAQNMVQRKQLAVRLQGDPKFAKQYEAALEKEVVQELLKADLTKLDAEVDELYRDVAEKYAPAMKAEKLANLCMNLARGASKGGELVLRMLLEKNNQPQVQGVACLALAQSMKQRADNQSAKDPKGAEKVFQESEALFERAIKEFANIKTPYYGTVGAKAKSELYEIRYLTVGKEAPDVEGEDQDGKKFKISDYKGKVILLDFWNQY